MKDQDIVALLWARDEQALKEIQETYGTYCRSIADGILHNSADAEECVNDTLLAAWNSIPPQRPEDLRTYLGKLTRRIAVDRLKYHLADKRGGGELPLILEELDECVPADWAIDETLHREELSRVMDAFLREQPPRDRQLFLRRYWFTESIAAIARRYYMGQSAVKMTLLRTREKLRAHLTREGFFP